MPYYKRIIQVLGGNLKVRFAMIFWAGWMVKNRSPSQRISQQSSKCLRMANKSYGQLPSSCSPLSMCLFGFLTVFCVSLCIFWLCVLFSKPSGFMQTNFGEANDPPFSQHASVKWAIMWSLWGAKWRKRVGFSQRQAPKIAVFALKNGLSTHINDVL